MATHGAARLATIRALSKREAFKRSGFAMTAVKGHAYSLGELPEEWKQQYEAARNEKRITYTVLSYHTPILWIEKDGFGIETIVSPNKRYSNTTTHHQSLANVYVTV